jgi:hypothetical protein
MHKKLIFGGMVLLALVLTGGTFAYTYPDAAATTLDGNMVGEAITNHQPSDDQPCWDDILPEQEYDSDYLLPCAAGDETNIPFQSPNSGEHWDKVNDLPADDGDTYVVNWFNNQYRRDLYHLTEYMNAEGSETISSVTVYFRFAGFTDGGDHTAYAKAAIKTYGTVFEGNE